MYDVDEALRDDRSISRRTGQGRPGAHLIMYAGSSAVFWSF